jgi:two-component system chemotaxis response regulator CheB
MKEKIKVMIVDDSAVVRETLAQILNSDSEIEVIATAADPIFAAQKLEKLNPDVITLDIEMPRMDGISFLRKLQATRPIPVVMCSSLVGPSSKFGLQALEFGATELVLKPKIGTKHFLEESTILIRDAVKSAYATKPRAKYISTAAPSGNTTRAVAPINLPEPHHRPFVQKLTADVMITAPNGYNKVETTEKIVIVGASTGGTEAIRVFLESYPERSPGTVIVQHMPEVFTASFAERLNSLCKARVKEAENGDKVEPNLVLIAPGGKHTLLKRANSNYYVEVKDGPLVTRHRPSVDVLFRSAAIHAGKNAIGVIMTGMGDDGARGMLEMHQAGAFTIAQDEESCVVFGMPGEAIKLGGVDKILPLKQIASKVLHLI